MEDYQWVVAMTRVISAVFRKGGSCAFLVDEMKVVFDPKGGYYKKGGKYMPSVVAEIGECIERHLKSLGLIHDEEPTAAVQAVLAEKKAAAGVEGSDFPAHAHLCSKCSVKAVISMDNCLTCLNCGDGKCG
jgi:hypothetical protein